MILTLRNSCCGPGWHGALDESQISRRFGIYSRCQPPTRSNASLRHSNQPLMPRTGASDRYVVGGLADVSAETPCARLHKPPPRKHALTPLTAILPIVMRGWPAFMELLVFNVPRL